MEHEELNEKNLKELDSETIDELHTQNWFRCIQHLPLSKTYQTLSLAGVCADKSEICQLTDLSARQIREVLICKVHILKLCKYVPFSHKYLTPNELKTVVAVIEILNEFMWRLARCGAEITDEELLENAKKIVRFFSVSHLEIDLNWLQFYRKTFRCKAPFELLVASARQKTRYDLKSLISSIDFMLDPVVLTKFENMAHMNNNLYLKCADLQRSSDIDSKMSNDVQKGVLQRISSTNLQFEKNDVLTNENETWVELKTENCDDLNENDCFEEIEIDETIFKKEICMDEEIQTSDENFFNKAIQNTALSKEKAKTNGSLEIKISSILKEKESENVENQIDKGQRAIDTNCNNKDADDIMEIFEVVDEDNENNSNIQPFKAAPEEHNPFQAVIAKNLPIKREIMETADQVESLSTEKSALELSAKNTNDDEQCIGIDYLGDPCLLKVKCEVSSHDYEVNTETKKQANITQKFINTEELHILDIVKDEPCHTEELHSSDIIKEPCYTEEGVEASSKRQESTAVVAEASFIEKINVEQTNVCIISSDKEFIGINTTYTPSCNLNTNAIHNFIPVYNVALVNHRVTRIAEIFYSQKIALKIPMLPLDPIIDFYMQISNANTRLNCLPKFNEDDLIFSIKAVLGQMFKSGYDFRLLPNNFELYRILVMFCYSLTYKSLDEIHLIMGCYDLKSMSKIFANYQQALESWRTLFINLIIRPAYKTTFYQILYEYRRRFMALTGAAEDKTILEKSLKIVEFLGGHFHLRENWYIDYNNYVKDLSKAEKWRSYEKLTSKDLEISNIYSDIKHTLSSVVVKMMSSLGIKIAAKFLHTNTITENISKSANTEHVHKSSVPMEQHAVSTVVHCSPAPTKNIKTYANTQTRGNGQIIYQIKTNAIQNVQVEDNYLDHLNYIEQNVTQNKQHAPDNTSAAENITQNINLAPKVQVEPNFKSNVIQNSTQNVPVLPKEKTTEEQIRKQVEFQHKRILTKLENHTVSEPPNKKPKTNSVSETSCELDMKSLNSKYKYQFEELPTIKLFKKYKEADLLKEIRYDPIIALYLKYSNSNNALDELPIYSERRLKKAFNEVMSENCTVIDKDMFTHDQLKLYRKLLLLHYNYQEVKTNYDLSRIMHCFSKKSIMHYTVNYKNIIWNWRLYFTKYISKLLYKQALYEMLYEYSKRYLRIFKRISDNSLRRKSLEVQQILRCRLKLPEHWIKQFSNLFKSRMNQEEFKISRKLTRNYLDLKTIYEQTSFRFHRFVQDSLKQYVIDEDEENMMPIKKMRIDILTKKDDKEENVQKMQEPNNEIQSSNAFVKEHQRGIEINIMEELEKDPIISAYMLSVQPKHGQPSALPSFDNFKLCLAFSEVFGDEHFVSQEELLLYRKLLLFKYSEQYTMLSDLAAIMACFDIDSIKQQFVNHLSVIEEWRQFIHNEFFEKLSLKVLNEMLCEYTIRYMRLFGHISDKALIEKANEICGFFNGVGQLPQNWLNTFNSMLLQRLAQTRFENNSKQTPQDLDLSRIYERLKTQLPFSVQKEAKKVSEAHVKDNGQRTNSAVKPKVVTIATVSNDMNTEALKNDAEVEYILPDDNEFLEKEKTNVVETENNTTRQGNVSNSEKKINVVKEKIQNLQVENKMVEKGHRPFQNPHEHTKKIKKHAYIYAQSLKNSLQKLKDLRDKTQRLVNDKPKTISTQKPNVLEDAKSTTMQDNYSSSKGLKNSNKEKIQIPQIKHNIVKKDNESIGNIEEKINTTSNETVTKLSIIILSEVNIQGVQNKNEEASKAHKILENIKALAQTVEANKIQTNEGSFHVEKGLSLNENPYVHKQQKTVNVLDDAEYRSNNFEKAKENDEFSDIDDDEKCETDIIASNIEDAGKVRDTDGDACDSENESELYDPIEEMYGIGNEAIYDPIEEMYDIRDEAINDPIEKMYDIRNEAIYDPLEKMYDVGNAGELDDTYKNESDEESYQQSYKGSTSEHEKVHWQLETLKSDERDIKNPLYRKSLNVTREGFYCMLYYDFKFGLTPQESFRRLQSAFGSQSPPKSTVFTWFLGFKRGRTITVKKGGV